MLSLGYLGGYVRDQENNTAARNHMIIFQEALIAPIADSLHCAQALSLHEMAGSWDALDELKREANLLKSLHHPGIPRCIAHFEVRAS